MFKRSYFYPIIAAANGLSKMGNEEWVVNIKFVLLTSWAKKLVECMGVSQNKNYKGMV